MEEKSETISAPGWGEYWKQSTGAIKVGIGQDEMWGNSSGMLAMF